MAVSTYDMAATVQQVAGRQVAGILVVDLARKQTGEAILLSSTVCM